MDPRPESLLLVEDDEATRTFLADNLAADGFQVASATAPDEAIRAIEVRQPDLVVLDLILEGGSGLGVLDRVRAAAPGAPRIDPDLPTALPRRSPPPRARRRRHQCRAAARRLGIRVGRRHAHDRRARLPPAAEAGRRRPAARAERPRRRLPTRGARVTASFAIAGWIAAAVLALRARALAGRLRAVGDAEHELRGPLTAVALAVESARRRPALRGLADSLESELVRARAGLADLTAARSGRLGPAVAARPELA